MKDPKSSPSLLSTTEPRARAAQLSRFAITVLPVVVAAAKFIFGWAWLSSWPLWGLLLFLALVRPLIGRPFPGWRERARAVALAGAWRLLGEILKAAVLEARSRP